MTLREIHGRCKARHGDHMTVNEMGDPYELCDACDMPWPCPDAANRAEPLGHVHRLGRQRDQPLPGRVGSDHRAPQATEAGGRRVRPEEFHISAYSSMGRGGWQWACRVCGYDRHVPNPPPPNVRYESSTYGTREEAEAAALASTHRCDGMVARSTEEKLDRILAILEGGESSVEQQASCPICGKPGFTCWYPENCVYRRHREESP